MTTAPPLDAAFERIVFSEDEIAVAVARVAARLAADFRGKPILLVGVLKGALLFTADLARALARIEQGPSEVRIDLLAVSSYGASNRSSGEVRLLKDMNESVEGQNVIIVEDIVDNGLTLSYLLGLLGGRAPASLKTCVLLDKPYRRAVQVNVDYVGLECPDVFIVGYGLDYQEKYRNLPYLAKLQPWVFSE